MSSQAVAWAIVHSAGGPSAKAVLLSIANYADASGECWQDQQTLADGAECSVRQFRTILYGLIERGLAEQVRRGSAGGGRLPNLIRLRMRELPAIISAKPPTVEQTPKTAGNPNRKRLPETQLPEKIADKVSGNLEGGFRQLVAGTIDNPTNPTNPLYPPGFEEAWKLWPKHVRASSKRLAVERLRKLNVADGAALVAAVQTYLRSPDATKDDRRFVPAFEVWLNRHAEFWLEQSQPSEHELQNRRALFDLDGTWHESWGPRPSKAQGGQE